MPRVEAALLAGAMLVGAASAWAQVAPQGTPAAGGASGPAPAASPSTKSAPVDATPPTSSAAPASATPAAPTAPASTATSRAPAAAAQEAPEPRPAGVQKGEGVAAAAPAPAEPKGRILAPGTQRMVLTGVLGRTVVDPGGESVGRIVDVLVDAEGAPRAAVIDFGGFMGLGTRRIAVRWSSITFPAGNPNAEVHLSLTPDQIKATPEFSGSGPEVAVVGPPPGPESPAATGAPFATPAAPATGSKSQRSAITTNTASGGTTAAGTPSEGAAKEGATGAGAKDARPSGEADRGRAAALPPAGGTASAPAASAPAVGKSPRP